MNVKFLDGDRRCYSCKSRVGSNIVLEFKWQTIILCGDCWNELREMVHILGPAKVERFSLRL